MAVPHDVAQPKVRNLDSHVAVEQQVLHRRCLKQRACMHALMWRTFV